MARVQHGRVFHADACARVGAISRAVLVVFTVLAGAVAAHGQRWRALTAVDRAVLASLGAGTCPVATLAHAAVVGAAGTVFVGATKAISAHITGGAGACAFLLGAFGTIAVPADRAAKVVAGTDTELTGDVITAQGPVAFTAAARAGVTICGAGATALIAATIIIAAFVAHLTGGDALILGFLHTEGIPLGVATKFVQVADTGFAFSRVASRARLGLTAGALGERGGRSQDEQTQGHAPQSEHGAEE